MAADDVRVVLGERPQWRTRGPVEVAEDDVLGDLRPRHPLVLRGARRTSRVVALRASTEGAVATALRTVPAVEPVAGPAVAAPAAPLAPILPTDVTSAVGAFRTATAVRTATAIGTLAERAPGRLPRPLLTLRATRPLVRPVPSAARTASATGRRARTTGPTPLRGPPTGRGTPTPLRTPAVCGSLPVCRPVTVHGSLAVRRTVTVCGSLTVRRPLTAGGTARACGTVVPTVPRATAIVAAGTLTSSPPVVVGPSVTRRVVAPAATTRPRGSLERRTGGADAVRAAARTSAVAGLRRPSAATSAGLVPAALRTAPALSAPGVTGPVRTPRPFTSDERATPARAGVTP
ncbi:hypothetical protein CUD01_15480 [Cellulomonas uda]|uniref:Uncharacterized protein n=1 Tax=Cellulomonas uda TaxID=1714 RepID=A0A4Y3KCK1_CELUD|nr:hypothetical protein CUD01_15480 [Cellulomonas uda]